jgi:myo-inositol-1(or 4)-monophosphatase
VLGVVYDVSRDLVYSSAKGQGAWLGSKRLAVNPRPLDDSTMLMLTSNLPNKDGRVPGWVTHWLGQTNWKIRILGTAAIEVVQVAAGVAHGSVTLQGKLWDIAAPAAILFEAGGVLTDLSGRPIFPFNLRNYAGAKVPFLSGTPLAHPTLLQQIRAYP